jgi:hypothetical protein
MNIDPKVFTKVIKEMYRVSKHNAEWFICFPHHRCDLFWDDYTHVRALSAKTFQMFDQKFNCETIERKLSESTFGLYHDVDIEIIDIKYNIINVWQQQLSNGMIGSQELNMKLNTLANICESVYVFVRVHKPGRFNHLVK